MNNKQRITNAYNNLDRKLFMETDKEYSKMDRPFPIGYGQTISQPSLVLKMTLLLAPKSNSKVLEIGTGSGYQTALLATLTKSVYTVELIEQLHLSAKTRLDNLGYKNIHFKQGDGHFGWSQHAPYDCIMVTAGASEIPQDLINQLTVNGKMVISVDSDYVQDLLLITKDSFGKVKCEFKGKGSFVDLVREDI